MKFRLTALALLAAVAAMPTIASAATVGNADTMTSTPQALSYPNVVLAADDDPTPALFQEEQAYLREVCPSVLAHPAGHSAVLDRFCREPRG
jgi:hypothetical protein